MSNVPLIIWNHRWEYDKNPEEFFEILYDLKKLSLKFEVAILGERYKKWPKIFDEAKQYLKDEIVAFGYVESQTEYKNWLEKGDVIIVTSKQDFFGESLVQAMGYNCYPLVPNRLVFPEHFPEGRRSEFVYTDYQNLLNKSISFIKNFGERNVVDVQQFVDKYTWSAIIGEYDAAFEKMIEQ